LKVAQAGQTTTTTAEAEEAALAETTTTTTRPTIGNYVQPKSTNSKLNCLTCSLEMLRDSQEATVKQHFTITKQLLVSFIA